MGHTTIKTERKYVGILLSKDEIEKFDKICEANNRGKSHQTREWIRSHYLAIKDDASSK